ncbi:non-specific lipid transfer protein GPI-anchored 2-like [Canna indica]|uniref:Non-specific lipid transfer protein GPI-anchored 2-like n=1 Tax=Canna indica TaxID=4628 RepID=A0AAQ3JYG3_9LILI|nr:non-specific lipid transfer protein GPI-anchored 2-like [Canna indica]
MAERAFVYMAAVLGVVMMLCVGGATAQSSDSCTSALVSLSPCLNYISGNETTPSSSCCSQLSSVVKSEPQCLCQVLNGGGSSFGITINQTQAMALPGACKVQTPPASKCSSSNGAPTGSPGTPSTPSVPAGGGSKTLPSSDNSGGSYAAAPASIIISLFAAASLWMSSFTF